MICTRRSARAIDHSRRCYRTGLRDRLCDSADCGSRSDPDDGIARRSDDHNSSHWRPDLSNAGRTRDAGVGRPVSAGYSPARADPAQENVALDASSGVARSAMRTVRSEAGTGRSPLSHASLSLRGADEASAPTQALLLHTFQQLLLCVAGRLGAASKLLGQEYLRRVVECHTILRTREAMAFVGKDVIFHRLAVLPHGSHDLIALGFIDARIVRPLPDQQRHFDLVRLEQRRLRLQNFFVVAHAFMKNRQEGRPVWGNRLE